MGEKSCSDTVQIRANFVRALWQHLSVNFASVIKSKSHSSISLFCAESLEFMGIMNAETFLQNYVTTIGRTIYVPYFVGVAENTRELIEQAMTGVHEHQHVQQFNMGGRSFMSDYLTIPSKRVMAEVEAIMASWEFAMALQAKSHSTIDLDPIRYAEQLRPYMLGDKDIALAAKALELGKTMVMDGAISTEAGRVSADFLISWPG